MVRFLLNDTSMNVMEFPSCSDEAKYLSLAVSE